MLYNEIHIKNKDSRIWVCGDIHGCFDQLEKELTRQDFNPETDYVFSVGDLVDRGPYSDQAIDYVMDKFWFHAIRGNHEEMLRPDTAGSSWHQSNGGNWYNAFEEVHGREKTQRMATILFNLPIAMSVRLPDGRLMGLVHASLPCLKREDEMFLTDWNDVQELLTQPLRFSDSNPFLWDREQVYRAIKLSRDNPEMISERKLREFNPPNVDLVFLGHTPLKEPLTLGKFNWIDTGAFAGEGRLTVKEVK